MVTKGKLNPQQIKFLQTYLNPKSKTFGNAYQSAIDSGFSVTYSKHITQVNPNWIYENVRRLNMLAKAEKNLDEFLDFDNENSNKLRVKFDTSKFIAERIGKVIYGQSDEQKGGDIKILVLPAELIQKNAIPISKPDAITESNSSRLTSVQGN